MRRYTIFEQMSAELAAVPAHRLRRPERAFRLEYEGERMVDEGGGYHEAISAACAELRAALPHTEAEETDSAAAAAAAASARDASSASGAEGTKPSRDAPTLSLSDALPIMIRTPNARRRNAVSDGAGRSVGSIAALGEMLPMPPPVELRKPVRRQQLRFLGQLLGIAVRSSSPIDVQLPRLVWKAIVLEARRVHGVLVPSSAVPPHDALRAWRTAQRLLLQRQQQQRPQQPHDGPRDLDCSSDDDSGEVEAPGDAAGCAAADALHVRSAAGAASAPLELVAESQALTAAALAAAAGLDAVLSRTVAAIEAELGSVDTVLCSTLSALAAANSEAAVAQLGLRFTSRGWRGDEVALLPRGAQCAVTLANRALYHDLAVRQRAEELHGALEPLCFGFAEIVRSHCARMPAACCSALHPVAWDPAAQDAAAPCALRYRQPTRGSPPHTSLTLLFPVRIAFPTARAHTTQVPSPLLSLYTPHELSVLASGEPDVDIALLRATCECTQGVHIDDSHVQYLFDVLEHDLVPAERVAWLRFVSGRTRLPPPAMMAEKYKHLTIKPLSKAENAMRDLRHAAARARGDRHGGGGTAARGAGSGGSNSGGASSASGHGGGGGGGGGVDTTQDGFLPESHTCFFYLDLPRYSSRDVMLERMRYAIATCRSIDNDATPASETGAFPIVDDVHPNAAQLRGWGAGAPLLRAQDNFAAPTRASAGDRPFTDPQVRHLSAAVDVENVPARPTRSQFVTAEIQRRRGLNRQRGGGGSGDVGRGAPPSLAAATRAARTRAPGAPAPSEQGGSRTAPRGRRVRRTLSGGLP
jgi:uncharacterized membrane protein YgcG